jgi:transposase
MVNAQEEFIASKQLFKAHNVSESTSYRIIKSKSSRRSDRVHNRGRKSVLAPYEREAIETVENSAFRVEIATHYSIASLIGLANGSERAIQRNMAEHGMSTYMVQQKKFIQQTSIQERGIWAFERRYPQKEHFYH